MRTSIRFSLGNTKRLSSSPKKRRIPDERTMQPNPLSVRRILTDNRIRPTKRKGQHFILDQGLVEKEVGYAELRASDRVFEIGAGLGALSMAIAARGNELVSIEIDSRLVKLLSATLKEQRNLSLVRADALTFEPRGINKIISNIPYNLSSSITFKILESEFETAILTYQVDFARRMIAKPGSKDYSRLSVNVYYRADAEIMDKIPRSAFYPMPSVDSAIVRLRRRETPFSVDDEGFFFKLLRGLFPYRNQLLTKVMKRFLRLNSYANLDALRIMKDAGVDDDRIRNLQPESIARLSNVLFNSVNR
ncbi:MAG: 16S rRNA (adenine(1518)-N(6)/adenine(1519)-N(6))-dimethyltransferase RsmA [Promethearchaeati archaeon SRVP18_Atabeyarchaeia-1]